MARYDFACAAGHVTERSVERSVTTAPCGSAGCRRMASRLPSLVGVTGIVRVPMRERKFPLGRMVEAQHTIVDQAQRAGVEPPDMLAIAKQRAKEIRRHRPDLIG